MEWSHIHHFSVHFSREVPYGWGSANRSWAALLIVFKPSRYSFVLC
jgi:hypothetical protein